MSKIVNIYGVSPEVRLKLKLLAAIHGRSMANMVSELIEQAYDTDKALLDRKQKSKVRRLIKRWGCNLGR